MNDQLAAKLVAYKPAPAAAKLIKSTPILLLVGPTGAGKDSLKTKLLKTGRYHHIISHTTRPPRINHGVAEQNGREYHFINLATATKMLDDQAFIEAKTYSDNLYATSLAEIQVAHEEGKTAMTDLEVQGVAEYKKLDPSVMAVFLLPPDFQTWQARLQRRYGDVVDAKDMRLRFQTALSEIDQLLNTDYYFAVINDQLTDTLIEIQNVTKHHRHDPASETKARQAAMAIYEDTKRHLNNI